jgi:hypothetical protein
MNIIEALLMFLCAFLNAHPAIIAAVIGAMIAVMAFIIIWGACYVAGVADEESGDGES